jgi:flagella basal body P-ring formation protein FlgA
MFLATMPEPKDFPASLRHRFPLAAKNVTAVPREILVYAGKPAMLSMHGGAMNISMRVICLDRGSLGQTIRVRDAAGRQIFHAKVIGLAAVQANL